MLPTQAQPPKPDNTASARERQNRREQNDIDKVSEENGRRKISMFRPADLHGNQLAADKKRGSAPKRAERGPVPHVHSAAIAKLPCGRTRQGLNPSGLTNLARRFRKMLRETGAPRNSNLSPCLVRGLLRASDSRQSHRGISRSQYRALAGVRKSWSWSYISPVDRNGRGEKLRRIMRSTNSPRLHDSAELLMPRERAILRLHMTRNCAFRPQYAG
jgi:hypothetical protein